MKSLRTKLNAEVDVVSVPNGVYRSFETVVCYEACCKENEMLILIIVDAVGCRSLMLKVLTRLW